MAADLYRVVAGATVSEPLTRDKAMARFADCVTLRLGRVRVLRDADYTPPNTGLYRGEAARRPSPIHFQPSTLRTRMACGEERDELPFVHMATFRLVDVTCTACLDAITAGSVASP
jgi:hypothetical protein